MTIRDYLRSRGVPFELMLHRPAPCASRLAASLHLPGRHLAKAVLLRAGGGYLLAVLPATHRVDLDRLGELLGLPRVALASEDEVGQVFPDCERGAVPPFGKKYGLTTVVDPSVAGGAEIVVAGSLRHEVLRLRYRDFEAIEGPVRARFACAAGPRRRLRKRQAG
jgi:Ala-tRNA(Pro) deacylase